MAKQPYKKKKGRDMHSCGDGCGCSERTHKLNRMGRGGKGAGGYKKDTSYVKKYTG